MAQERRKTLVGEVVSNKSSKTVMVQVATRARHPLYGKTITKTKRFAAHNEEPEAKLGDQVKITESRPLSRTKRWRVTEIIRRGDVVEAIRERELESLLEKERADKEARREEERRRAAARLAELGGGGLEVEAEEEEEEEGGEDEEAE
jgi:small subunit ribosomal protein S17